MDPYPDARASGDTMPRMQLRAGWLLDGSGGPPRPDVRIAITGGKILSIESIPSASPVEPGEIDLRDCTVLPGLVDAHVHLAMSGSVDEAARARLRAAPPGVVGRTIADHLDRHLRHGVTAVRDAGGARGSAAEWCFGHAHPVRVRAAGRAWHRAGRYGRRIGRAVPEGASLDRAVADDVESGDHVKIVNSGVNSLTEYARRTAPQFELEELQAAVRAAAAGGRDVMVHANGEQPVRIAVTAGCRSIEHGFFMGRDNLARMAERGTVWVPTAVTMQAFAAHLERTGRSPDTARRTLDHQIEQLAAARELGVTVAVGTDAGAPGVEHGESVIDEIECLLQAGYTIGEAVRCAAVHGAGLVGAETGLLQPGGRATLVAVPNPPDGIPAALRQPRAVIIDGLTSC
jgi:imidazolonepropionase-like amidohydrolase